MEPTQTQNPNARDKEIGVHVEVHDSSPSSHDAVELGRGRSGVVYLGFDDEGEKLACKVFASSGLTKLVQCLFLGTPNPYIWNEDAVRCVVLRRRILVDLVDFWFGGKVRVAAARHQQWNVEHRAYELHTEFSPGDPVPLHHPFRTQGEGRLDELTSEVMRPLQRHLLDAGFDGLAWQAGKGNPVALNNFLYEAEAERWVWIDLESGVPALFPANPIAFFRFYLPRAFRLGRPLFDDVDPEKLLRYISKNYAALAGHLGEHRMPCLREHCIALREYQAAWKNLPWLWRSIDYRLSQEEITENQAVFYRTSRFRWMGREVVRYALGGVRSLVGGAQRVGKFLGGVRWRAVPRFVGRLVSSTRFRGVVAKLFVASRIQAWCERGQLTSDQAGVLRARLREEESSAYLGDFGMHLAIKPLVKAIEFWVLPAMWIAGWIGGGTLAISMLACGPVVRTLYTMMRMTQASRDGIERPWVALGVGLIPIVGNFAYPLQILYSSTEKDLARFILYDGGARVGALMPIWGGKDTWTEHWFNRLPDFFVNVRGRGC